VVFIVLVASLHFTMLFLIRFTVVFVAIGAVDDRTFTFVVILML